MIGRLWLKKAAGMIVAGLALTWAMAAPVQAAALRRAAAAAASAGCAPCIQYRHHGRPLDCCGCGPSIQTVLCVRDPVTCCTVLVPVCLPHCCSDAPCVSSRVGLFRRGIVDHDWNCGLRVRVVFSKHGDVVVHYFGA